jgi:transposase
MRRRKYNAEFKESAVQLAMDSGKSITDIAKDLEVNESTLHNWITAHKKANGIDIPSRNIARNSSLKESELEELARLRKEVRQLKQEKEILKKAASYFARETV